MRQVLQYLFLPHILRYFLSVTTSFSCSWQAAWNENKKDQAVVGSVADPESGALWPLCIRSRDNFFRISILDPTHESWRTFWEFSRKSLGKKYLNFLSINYKFSKPVQKLFFYIYGYLKVKIDVFFPPLFCCWFRDWGWKKIVSGIKNPRSATLVVGMASPPILRCLTQPLGSALKCVQSWSLEEKCGFWKVE